MYQHDPIELADAADRAGIPQAELIAWYNANKSNAAYKNADSADDLVNLYKTVKVASRLEDLKAREAGNTPPVAPTSAPTAPAQQSVTVTGQRPPIPTTVNPYAGTAQEAAAGESGNPAARSLSQYDPAAVAAAQNDFKRQWDEGSTGRNIGNFIAAFGGQRSRDYARQVDQDTYTRLKDATVGAQLRQQEAATAGLLAGSNESTRLRDEGAFTGTQREQQQKLELGQVAVNTAKRMNDPSSAETVLAKAMLADQLKTAGMHSPELTALMASGNVTAQQLSGFMDPKVLESYKTKIGIQGSIQEVRKARAEADIAENTANTVAPQGTPPAAPTAPAGSRNNPGNLRPAGSNTGFQAFNTPQEGITAIDKQLEIYGSKHGVNTLRGVISRWSPPNENATEQLVANAARRLGISPDQKIDLSNPVQRQAITTAIMMQENPIFGKSAPAAAPTQPTSGVPPRGTGRLQLPAGTVPTVSVGGVTLTSPKAQAESAAAGQAAAEESKRAELAKSVGLPAIDDAIAQLSKSYSGKGAAWYASVIPANEQAMVANALMRAYQINSAVLPPEIAASITRQQNQPGWTGVPNLALTGEQATRILKQLRGDIVELGRQRAAKTEYENKGGKSSEFHSSPEAARPAMVRMRKGDRTIEVPADKISRAEAQGFRKE